MAGGARELVTTPNAWTEVANIINDGVRPPLARALMFGLKVEIACCAEIYHHSRDAADDRAFSYLGLSDAALLLSLDKDTTLLTTDAPLCREASARGYHAVNFHHLREERGLVG